MCQKKEKEMENSLTRVIFLLAVGERESRIYSTPRECGIYFNQRRSGIYSTPRESGIYFSTLPRVNTRRNRVTVARSTARSEKKGEKSTVKLVAWSGSLSYSRLRYWLEILVQYGFGTIRFLRFFILLVARRISRIGVDPPARLQTYLVPTCQ